MGDRCGLGSGFEERCPATVAGRAERNPESSPRAVAGTAVPPAGRSTVPLSVPAGSGGGAFAGPRGLTVPAGWTAAVWARVPDARMEAWSPDGGLLVSEPDQGQVVELVPGAKAQDPPRQRPVLSGLPQPQGLAFARLAGHSVLYVGESDQIDRYDWAAGAVTG